MNMYLSAFLVGGLICAIGQIIIDSTKYTQGHILSAFTITGGVLSGLGIYEHLIDFAGAGATIPISSFGNALVQGALKEASKDGIMGVLAGMFEMTSSGITAAIVFSFFMALIFKPKG